MFTRKSYNIIFVVIVIIMALPLLQQIFGFPKIARLKGYFVEAQKPTFVGNNLWSGTYQDSLNKYVEDHIGFRPDLVRVNNTVDYYLYGRLNTNSVILGKENYTFEEGYINATLGRDFIGEDSIASILYKVKFIQNKLQEKDITFLLLYAPGKATFFPEYIPEKYHPDSITKTNYEAFIAQTTASEINNIDYNRWFLQMKDTSSYPLYPQYGIHWSYYGMLLTLDSLVHRIEKERNIDMVDMSWDRIDLSRKFKNTDYDLGKALNLLWQLPTYKLAYPHLSFEKISEKDSPKLLAVSDSYFWNWYGTGFTNRFFKKTDFLYYFNQHFSSEFSGSKTTSTLNLVPFVESHEVVVVMATDGNLKTFAFGFINKLYEEYLKLDALPTLEFSWYDANYVSIEQGEDIKILRKTPNGKTVLKNTNLDLQPNSKYVLSYEAKGFKYLEMDFYPYMKVPVYLNDAITDNWKWYSWEFETDGNPESASLRIYMDYAEEFSKATYLRNFKLQN